MRTPRCFSQPRTKTAWAIEAQKTRVREPGRRSQASQRVSIRFCVWTAADSLAGSNRRFLHGIEAGE